MNNPVMYIFINKSLNMSSGKVAAQAAHAAIMGACDSGERKQIAWEQSVHKTIIVLEARDEAHLRNIKEYLDQRNFNSSLIIDEGVNEIDAHTCTALASNILEKDDEQVIKAFSSFDLYRPTIKFTVELDK